MKKKSIKIVIWENKAFDKGQAQAFVGEPLVYEDGMVSSYNLGTGETTEGKRIQGGLKDAVNDCYHRFWDPNLEWKDWEGKTWYGGKVYSRILGAAELFPERGGALYEMLAQNKGDTEFAYQVEQLVAKAFALGVEHQRKSADKRHRFSRDE